MEGDQEEEEVIANFKVLLIKQKTTDGINIKFLMDTRLIELMMHLSTDMMWSLVVVIHAWYALNQDARLKRLWVSMLLPLRAIFSFEYYNNIDK